MNVVFEFLGRHSPVQVPEPREQGPVMRLRKVTYIILNSLGSIVVVYDDHRVVRKANVADHLAIRIPNPAEYLNRFHTDPVVSLTIGLDATVLLMYCHRVCQEVKSSTCRGVFLLGPTQIAFADPADETMEAQEQHDRQCHCGHLCHSRPPTFALSPEDRLVLFSGVYYVRACSESHTIYISKSTFLSEKVQYYAKTTAQSVKLLAFVKALSDGVDNRVSIALKPN